MNAFVLALLKKEASILPSGISARIDGPDLFRILEEREELLAALQELVARRDERTAGTPRADGTDGRYARARAAIAKAVES